MQWLHQVYQKTKQVFYVATGFDASDGDELNYLYWILVYSGQFLVRWTTRFYWHFQLWLFYQVTFPKDATNQIIFKEILADFEMYPEISLFLLLLISKIGKP